VSASILTQITQACMAGLASLQPGTRRATAYAIHRNQLPTSGDPRKAGPAPSPPVQRRLHQGRPNSGAVGTAHASKLTTKQRRLSRSSSLAQFAFLLVL
jgi:hypothetical protein